MTTVLTGEYRNQNGLRKYPFGDNCTLTDASGATLPTDFIIDAFLYIIDLVNEPYISKIDLSAKRIYIADSVTGKVCGFADFDSGDEFAFVYDNEVYLRQIGILTFGPGLADIFQGSVIRTFAVEAATLSPVAYVSLQQEGVRGILLPDGTLFMNDVLIEGQDGITVSSDGTTDIITIDVYGVPRSSAVECGDECPLITRVCFERVPGSSFMISQYDSKTVALSAYDFSLEDICDGRKAQVLPDSEGNLPRKRKSGDPCEPVTPTPPTPDPGPEVTFCIDIVDLNGTITIITPSTPGAFNPVYIAESSNTGLQALSRLVTKTLPNIDQTDNVDKFTNPSIMAGMIEIGIKGLSTYKRKNT